jgi:hypothetical protein
MDSVLSRKLFREKYTQEIKPQKFNQGGIATLKLATGGEVFTEGEKLGYMLAPIAASLLQAKQRPGESSLSSLFGAVGEGVAKIPDIGVAIKKIEVAGQKESKGANMFMSPEQVAATGLPTGTVAQYNTETGAVNVINKPSEESQKTAREAIGNINLVNRIADQYVSLNKPVGPFVLDPDRLKGIAGEFVGSDYGKQYAGFKSNIGTLQAFLQKQISGATLSEPEVKRLQALIPQLGDTEAEFEGKIVQLKGYLTDIKDLQKTNPEITPSRGMEIIEKTKGGVSAYAPQYQAGAKSYKIKGNSLEEIK